MEIVYQTGIIPPTDSIIELYKNAGLPRPTGDAERIRKMFVHSNLVITAWQQEQLVGVCRCITDWAWVCYLSDLAVDPNCKKSGIGKNLVALTRKTLGEEVMILLLSVPDAMDYYPKIGFEKENRGFTIKRTR